MISIPFKTLHLDLKGALAKWDSTISRADVVPSIIVACTSALLFNGLGLLWFVANVELRPIPFNIVALLFLGVVVAGYCTIRFSPVIATVLAFILALQTARIFGVASGYLVYSAGAQYPLVDAQLYAIDQSLGFDWVTMLRWFDGYPGLVDLTRVAYDEAATQGILALPILILARQHDRLMKMLTATFLALIVVHVVSIFLPAVGAYAYLGVTAADHPQMVLSSGGHTAVHVMQLRTGAPFDLNGVPLMGLITFPSFHTVMAIQAIWAFWQIPVLRWLAVAFNFAVWAGTLLHGSHHLIDTVAGAIVAIATIYAAIWLTERARRKLYGRGVSAH